MTDVGALRVTARRQAPFRRAGFVFGAQATLLSATSLTPAQVLSILNEPMLTSEISYDGETWYTPPTEFRAGLASLVEATSGLSTEAVRDRLASGDLDVDDIIRDAMMRQPSAFPGLRDADNVEPVPALDIQIGGVDPVTEAETKVALAAGAIAAAEPGRGAGADHPGASFEVVPQPAVDPNPALPAGGGTTDAGIAVRAADGVRTEMVDQPVPAPVLDAELAAEVVAPAEPVVVAPAAVAVARAKPAPRPKRG